MKKGVAVILCLLMAVSCLLLQAYGDTGKKDLSGSKYIGTWKAVSVSIKDVEEPFEKECYLVLNADGTAKFSSDKEVTECTWSETGTGFKRICREGPVLEKEEILWES